MNKNIYSTCDQLVKEFDAISVERKALLEKIANYVSEKKSENLPVQLMYVCTHNSRRSHFGQIWAAVAAEYFKIDKVSTFSGGTEATSFNINAIHALQQIGFKIHSKDETLNPIYEVFFSEQAPPIICFSKVFNDESNPSSNFAAIMTCGDAEENCPFIPGVELRVATTYNDPKMFDGTEQQEEKYMERALQIALETLYVFSKVL